MKSGSAYFTLPSFFWMTAASSTTSEPLLGPPDNSTSGEEEDQSNSTSEEDQSNSTSEEEDQSNNSSSGWDTSGFPLTKGETLAVLSLFSLFVAGMISIYLTMPNANKSVFKLPRNLEELRKLTEYLSVYAKDHTSQVLLGYIVSYIFLQTFMIPGTILMSLLAGALFGEYYGLVLVVATATAGASSSYLLSKLIGRPLVNWLWPDKLAFFREEVAKRKDKLFNYMLFLRITPTLPNTFINVSSPIVDIPFDTFFWATLIGLVPAAFVTVRAGLKLGELQSLSDLYDIKTIATLFFIGLVSILPTLVRMSRTPKL